MKKRKLSVIDIVFLLLILSKIQSRLITPFFDDNYVLMMGSVFITATVLYKRKGKVPVVWFRLIGVLLIYLVIFTFVFTNQQVISFIYRNALSFTAFVCIVFMYSLYIKANGTEWHVVRYMYYLIGFFLVGCLVIHIREVDLFGTVKTMLQTNRVRAAFGFVQENTTAEMCLIPLALSLILRAYNADKMINIRKAEKLVVYALDVVAWTMLILTASRGGILAGLSLYAIYFFILSDKRKQLLSTRMIKRLGITGLLAVSFVFFLFAFVITKRFDISYRLRNFTVNIPTLISTNSLLTGMGFVDKSVFANARYIAGTGYTDNYFLYVLVSTGLVGLVMIISYIVILLNAIRKREYSFTKASVYACLGMVFVFSLTEADFINPASVLSIVTMVVFLSYALGCFPQKAR